MVGQRATITWLALVHGGWAEAGSLQRECNGPHFTICIPNHKDGSIAGPSNGIGKTKTAEKNSLLAHMEGKLTELEKNFNDRLILVKQSHPKEIHTNNKPSFSAVVKSAPVNIHQTKQNKQAIKPRKQYLAIIKPKNDTSNSSDTKNFIQKSVDITRVKIGVKKVTNVRKGGILIETVDQTDLDKLLMELDSNPEVKTNFEIGKPIQTNPQVICYGVSNETTEETVANSIKQHCSLEETSQDVKIIHNFRVSRGRNWIIETTPEIFKILSKTTKMNIGWERISYKDIRPKQCFKCCKFGHLAKHCKEEKDLRTNCGSSEHTWKNCKASPKCINCLHPNVQEKIHQELDIALGADSCSFGRRSQRTHMPGVRPKGGCKIPKRTTVIVSPFLVHRDEDVFPDPEKFDPDRFLPENSSHIPECAYIPFAAGPRNCMGRVFGEMEVKVLVCHILRSFSFTLWTRETKCFRRETQSLQSSQPARIKFRRRQ
ncbi:uncharacterized protein CEXT_364931 [Caerostris extrusa]|uniref:CCHC-type domain-containing protein n=1 Tax=Caerostris extrusa TaxID=172846 RepID=A0AAV4QV94_CAEEX|nr:uncharacterized protein CEXT_364931 [Caerostris extrusa]